MNFMVFFIIFVLHECMSIKIEDVTILWQHPVSSARQIVLNEFKNISYVAAGDSGDGILIFDVSDPYSPEFIINYYQPSLIPKGVVCSKNILYSPSTTGMLIFDVSNPSSPILLSTAGDPVSDYQRAVFSNDLIYLIGLSSGLEIINVSDPINPFQVGKYQTSSDTEDINVIDGIAYLATGSNGLLILDVFDPTNITMLAVYDTPDWASGVSVFNHIAAVSDRYYGSLIFINVSNPSHPIHISNISVIEMQNLAFSSAFNGNDILYQANGAGGLKIIDISNIYDPKYIGTFESPLAYYIVAENDNIVHIVDYSEGYYIYKVNFETKQSSDGESNFFAAGSLNLYLVLTTSSLSVLLIILFVCNTKLLYSATYHYDKYYILLAVIGICNFISDVMLIAFLFISDYLDYFFVSLSFILLSIILSYFRTRKWSNLLVLTQDPIYKRYLINNRTVFNYIVNLSIIIHPSLLFLLECNWNHRFRFPITGNVVAISVQCLLSDFYSLLPQSIVLYFFAFQTLDWDIILWIIIILKFLNQIVGISRVFMILYKSGGRSSIKRAEKKEDNYGVFQTIKVVAAPGLVSFVDSKLESTIEPPMLLKKTSFLDWASRSQHNVLSSGINLEKIDDRITESEKESEDLNISLSESS